MQVQTGEKFRRKIKNSNGETISETLVSLLVIVLALTMLAGSIVSASKVNRQVRDSNTAFVTSDTDSTESGTVTIEHGTGGKTEISVTVTNTKTEDQDGYVFYKKSGS